VNDNAYAPGSELPGGYINPLVRIGDTVRRPRDANSPFVEALLTHFEASGFEGAPRFLGIDEEGRQILSYVEGHVAWESGSLQPPGVWSDESLIEVARLTRRFHDLTAGTSLAGDREVVCHNDLTARNTVYRDAGTGYRPVAFIDWDGAAPGDRANDLCYIFWHFLCPCPRHPDVEGHARRLNAMLDAYGFDGERTELVPRMLRRMQDSMAGIEAKADSGDPAYVRLVRLGAIESMTGVHEWVAENQVQLEAAIEGR
jgi:Ser/Thr protein kinase RdoA (MazF antagonist)